ncbi:MAG: carbamoyl-phosphate synthase large subunit [Clostridiaceae bacterium]|jgi:carbamoyl-phosphate synthase large subunit|nr:carbamoyl-phosphate synthase large subunit [Clostridiaceae bacterium]
MSFKKILIIGNGASVIGQSAEYGYAAAQAAAVFKAHGASVVIADSNAAAYHTDRCAADKVYIEPLKADIIKNIIDAEKPCAVYTAAGGSVAFRIAAELESGGYLRRAGVKLIGVSAETAKAAKERESFKNTVASVGEPFLENTVTGSLKDAAAFAAEVGYPVFVRPADVFCVASGAIAGSLDELKGISESALKESRFREILIEKSVAGDKETEIDLIRDAEGRTVVVAVSENIDACGINPGDSIVVMPQCTLTKKQTETLRAAAVRLAGAFAVTGACNIRFAVSGDNYYVTDVNPGYSRSSALAEKVTGYPIAAVSAAIALGEKADAPLIGGVKFKKAYETPATGAVAVRIPRWPFNKFTEANRKLGTVMKSTGEIVGVGATFEEAFLKATRSLELGNPGAVFGAYSTFTDEEIRVRLPISDDERLFIVMQALLRGMNPKKVAEAVRADVWFIDKLAGIARLENDIRNKGKAFLTAGNLQKAKRFGFSDAQTASLAGVTVAAVAKARADFGIFPAYAALSPNAFYSTYNGGKPITALGSKTAVVIGGGPFRIGQGLEFDYAAVKCAKALKAEGYSTVIINCNPSALSAGAAAADRIYIEPLTDEDVLNVLAAEKPAGTVVQCGGRSAAKLGGAVADAGYVILGTAPQDTARAEDDKSFDGILKDLGLVRPQSRTVSAVSQAEDAAEELGFPVILRPGRVFSGRGMEIAYNGDDVRDFMATAGGADKEPVKVDKYVIGMEIELDAVSDGTDVLIPGIMEHIERSGVHSGDSITVYPSLHISAEKTREIVAAAGKVARALKVKGLINFQFIISNNAGGKLYLIEVGTRSSRTVPFISKITGIPVIDLAVKCMTGARLEDLGYGTGLYRLSSVYSVKAPVFSGEKLPDLEISAGPEMKSTGAVAGVAETYPEALLKALTASGIKIGRGAGVLLSVSESFKPEILESARELDSMGFKIFATEGTSKFLRENSIHSIAVSKLDQRNNGDITYLLKKGSIELVVNTPTKGRGSSRDGFKIRRAAVEAGVPCLTSVDTANALCKALLLNKSEKDLKPLSINDLD